MNELGRSSFVDPLLLVIEPARVGLAITVADQETEQLHIGVFATWPKPFILHLAWHYRLERETPVPLQYRLLQMEDIPPERVIAIAGMLMDIFDRNRDGIPYAVLYRNTKFLADGTMVLGQGEHGLTCATFVMAALKASGIPLLDESSWITRNDDEIWHGRIVAALQATHSRRPSPGGEGHVACVAQEKPCVRFRPEEVACGHVSVARPVSFSQASRGGKEIAAKLLQRR